MAAKKPTSDDVLSALSKVDVTEKPVGSAVKPKGKPAKVAPVPKSGAKPKVKAGEKDGRINFYCTAEEKQIIKVKSATSGESIGDIFMNALRKSGFFEE